MSWFKVDDKLWGHPKWLATPIRSRGLWVTAGSWSADQEQDGNIPRHVLPILGATVRDASALVAVDLWVATDTGWCFHGWAEFQPTREQKEGEREAARERMRAGRERKAAMRSGGVRPNISEVREMFGDGSEDVRSTPTRPDPTRPVTTTPDGVVGQRSSTIPDDWAPTDAHRTRARDEGLDVEREAMKFRSHYEATNKKMVRWNAAFTTWLINSGDYTKRDGRTRATTQTKVTSTLTLAAQYEAEEQLQLEGGRP